MSTVTTTSTEGVMLITLNRPEALNAFSNQLMDDLTEALLAATADAGIRVAVITGAGRAFSAGADLLEMGRNSSPPVHGFAGLLDALIDFPKPLLLAVNGLGVGIGATICGLADITVMARSARLRCPFLDSGTDSGSRQHLHLSKAHGSTASQLVSVVQRMAGRRSLP
jgi:enoyl-CoA hydratase/carnithine racemase